MEAQLPGMPDGLKHLADFWTEGECRGIEWDIEATKALAEAGKFKKHTVDGTPLRSKYFFGYGYTYGAQMAGKGGEKMIPQELVDPIPQWIWERLIAPIEAKGLVPPGFINSAVMNDYKPGGMIVSHIDPPQLFDRPIFICSFYASARLVFGGGFSFASDTEPPRPPKYIAPMAPGSLVVMDGYSANGMKHGIRPMDLDGRRVSICLRHVFPDAPCVDVDVPLPPAQRGAKHEQLSRWLLEVDGGEGFLLDHLRPLSVRFPTVGEATRAYGAAVGRGDEAKFFDELGVQKLGHQRLFTKWFCAHGLGRWPAAADHHH